MIIDTDERLQDLVCLVNNRLREFGPDAFPLLSWGIVRLMLGAVREWEEKTTIKPAPLRGIDDGIFAAGPLQIFEWPGTGRLVPDGTDATNTGAPMLNSTNGTVLNDHTDYAALESAWPTMPDLDGVDVFAAEHGPATGEAEPTAQEMGEDYGLDDDEPPAPVTHPAAVPANTPAAFKAELERMTDTLDPALRHLYPRPATRLGIDELPQLEADLKAVIAYIQEIAEDGVMPTILAYNATRPKGTLLAWSTIPKRYLIASWRELADICGLRLKRKGSGAADLAEANDDDSDKPKHPRRMGYEYGRPEAERKFEQPTQQQLVGWLRANAMGGVMMTQEQFNESKPAHWATATAQVMRLHTSWGALREEAGLKVNPRWGRTWADTDAAA